MEPVISQQTRSIATMLFESFCNAQTMQEILAIHREINNLSNMQPARFTEYFPKIKSLLSGSWKAQALFKKFESRANMKEYKKNKACTHNRVLISGAGPAGLKMAMECQLLGAKVVVLEKRDKFSRNNVVHLWDFVITDMISLGAKTFHGKFCAGSINHISIRQLQYILLKMALLMGVEVHEGVKFIDIIKPEKLSEHEALGWRAQLEPSDHPASQYEFDALVGADGRRNSLRGFQKKELRTKQCIGITANFINRNTEREAAVTEIGGVSYIFAQQFFDDIKNSTNIDLENITYYKDETHYFVMTAKKQSLLEKGVLIQDHKNVSILLSRENVSKKELMSYALEAAQTATKGQLPNMCFAFNHCGEPDVAIFDFSTSFISENASIVYEMHGKRLLCQLIGDSLLEPFWPTGSGCARCFLSAMDAAWAIRAYGCRPELHPLEVIAERESVYRILPQAISTNLQLNIAGYTIDPSTRYINLNKSSVLPNSVNRLYLSDNPVDVNATRKHTLPRAKKKEPLPAEYLLKWAGYDDLQTATSSKGLWNIVKKYRPDLLPEEREENFRKIYKLLTQKFELKPYTNDTKPHCYLMAVYKIFHGEIPHTKYDTKILEQLPLAVTQRAISNAEEKTDSPQPAAPKTKGFSVSIETADFIRKQIGKLDLNDITRLAHLMDGHDAISDSEIYFKQKEIQEKIIAILDPDESSDPTTVREAITGLLEGSTKMKINTTEQSHLAKYFVTEERKGHEEKRKRHLKGLDPDSVKVPDVCFEDSDTNVEASLNILKDEKKSIKKLVRSYSDECSDVCPKPLDIVNRRKNSDSMVHSVVSNSFGSSEMGHGIKKMTDLFERQMNIKLQSNPSVFIPNEDQRIDRNPRWQHVVDIMEGKQQDVSNSVSKKVESIGNVEVAERRQKITELLLGLPREAAPGTSYRRNSGEMAFRMQRVTDMIAKKNSEAKRPKSMSRRKVREFMKDRMERSLHLLSLQPPPCLSYTNLDHDYDLQKYRAEAPEFDERVKKLERQLQHYGESAIEPMKASGGGMKVAKLAAELNSPALPTAKSMKPKDLLRSIGKISQEDWQIKQIERKINENRLGRPVPSAAQHVPKWDREQFLRRRKKMESSDKPAEVDKVEKDIPAKGNVEKLVKRFRVESPIRKIEPKFHTSQAIAHEEVKQPWKGYISLSDSSIDTKPVRGLDRHPNDVLRGPPTTALAEKIYVDLSESDEIEEKIFMKINNISQPNSYMGYSVTDKTGAGAMWCPPKIAERHKQDQATSSYDGSASSVGSAVVNKPRDTRPKKREAAAKKEVSTSETETESDEEESDSSDDEQSSATGVSTDSEFACEESTVNLSPPEILVTEAPPNIVPPPQDYPLSRAKSAGGLATKRALELKRKYLLGEPSPPAVRKSDSTSQIDTKLEAFCLNITEFQKMLHPATPTPQTGVTPVFSYQFNLEEKKQPDIPDIIKNICNNVPIDLLTKGDSIISWDKQEEKDSDLETDSLSDESSTSDTAPNQSVPRVEVHDEGGELIQLDSLILISEVDDMDEKLTRAATSSGPTMVAGESESSESCKDATTCALTETELSDWAAESVDVDECGLDVNGERNRNKSPRILSGPKLIHDAVNIESISSHVCGRDGLESELVVYSNAPEYFEFADEGDQDPTILSTPSNEGYLELVDDYSTSKDRSINFIERVCSDTTVKPDTNDTLDMIASKFSDTLEYIDIQKSTSDGVINTGKVSKQILPSYENTNFGTNATNVSTNSSVNILKNVDSGIYEAINVSKICMESLNSIEESPPLLSNTDIKDVSISDSTTKSRNSLEDISPPLVSDSLSHAYSLTKISPIHGEQLKKMRNYSPAICRSVSETFGGSRNSTITTSHDNDWMIPLSYKDLTADDSYHPVSSQTSKVQELKRERDEQTEVVRRLVLERLGGAKVNRKASRRNRIVPSNIAPPPVPPPPLLPALMLPFPEVPPRPSLQPRLSLAAQTSFSDPELNREQRPGKSFFKSISNYFNKRLGPKCKCVSEPDLTTHRQPSVKERAPAVPPLPDIKTTRGGTLPRQKNLVRKPSVNDPEKGDLMRKSRLNELNIKLSKATSDVERARIVASITEIKNLIESRTNMDAAAAHMMRATWGSVGD